MNREYYIELLKSLVVSDYVYIDYPMYLNIGDSFIALGAIELLSNIPYKCRYFSSYSCFDYKKIREDDVIIMHGGGNFGDLYKGANEFRNEIIRKFPNNKIIFFPQTIFYENVEGLSKDAEIMNRHSDLTVLVRDKRSFDLARGYFTNNIILFPDTAFFWILIKRK